MTEKNEIALINRAEKAELQRDELAEALRRSMTALDDWLNLYAEEECDPIRVSEAHQRIKEYGTVWYIAEVQQQNREALAKIEGARK